MLYYIHTENTPVSNANGAAYLAKQAALLYRVPSSRSTTTRPDSCIFAETGLIEGIYAQMPRHCVSPWEIWSGTGMPPARVHWLSPANKDCVAKPKEDCLLFKMLSTISFWAVGVI